MEKEIGVTVTRDNAFECRFATNLDCFHWVTRIPSAFFELFRQVKRDSYLPQGSHGLKAVTKAKLGYATSSVPRDDV